MELHHFSAFFEACAALNFLYAGSEDFRFGVNEQIWALNTNVTSAIRLQTTSYLKSIETALSRLPITIGTPQFIEAKSMRKILNKYSQELAENHSDFKTDLDHLILCDKKILEKEKEQAKFTDGFKTLFTLGGLVCFYFLLAEGYAEFYDYITPPIIPSCLFIFALFLWPYILYELIKSFDSVELSDPVNPAYVLVFFLGSVAVSIDMCHYRMQFCMDCMFGKKLCLLYFPDKFVISIFILTALSPYIVHTLRMIFHKVRFTWKGLVLRFRLRLLNKILKKIDFYLNDDEVMVMLDQLKETAQKSEGTMHEAVDYLRSKAADFLFIVVRDFWDLICFKAFVFLHKRIYNWQE